MQFLLASVFGLICQTDQSTVDELIRRLGSESIQQRTEAEKELTNLGPRTLGALDRVAAGPDPEIAARARRVAKTVRVRTILTPALRNAIFNIEQRLLKKGDPGYTETLIELVPRSHFRPGKLPVKTEVLANLAPHAVRGAQTVNEKKRVCQIILWWQLKGATEEVIKLLADESGEVRAGAIAVLPYVRARRFAGRIRPHLKDPSPEARGAAAYALAFLGEKDDGPAIATLLRDDDPAVRRAACRSLGFLGNKEVAKAIAPLLKDPDSNVRTTAVLSLCWLENREVCSMIAPLLEDKTYRTGAISALQALKCPELIPDLIKLLDSPLSSGYTAEALGELGVKEAVPKLLRLLKESASVDYRMTARALGRLGAKEAASDILRLLKEGVPSARSTMAIAIGDLKATELLPELLELAEQDDSHTAAAAIQAIGAIGNKEQFKYVEPLLKNNSSNVRAAATRALSRLDPQRAGQFVLPLLSDSDAKVRTECLIAIREIGDKEAAPQLARLLTDSERSVRDAAARNLCLLEAVRGVPQYLAAREKERRAPLFALNALRRPGLASRLYDIPVNGFMEHMAEALFNMLGEELGLPVDVSTLTPYERECMRLSGGNYKRSQLLDALEQASRGSATEIIIEEDRIRIVPRDEGLRFWTKWWADQKENKRK